MEAAVRRTEVLRAAATTPVRKLASAIAWRLEEVGEAGTTLEAVGSHAVNQSVKALAVARSWLVPRGCDLVFSVGIEERGPDLPPITRFTILPR